MVPWFHGSIVICDCSAVQPGVCLSKYLVTVYQNSLSDHSPIITWLKVNRHLDNDSSNEAIIKDSLTPLPKQFFWENDSSQKFRATLQSEDIQRMIT